MLRKLNLSMVIAAFSLAGCLGGSGTGTGTGTGTGDGTGDQTQAPSGSLGLGAGSTVGGEGNTFDHEGDALGPESDPFAVLQRVQAEGPPEISTKMHSCQKMRYTTVGNVLTALGVNMAATAATSAGVLYKGGAQAMGSPNYAARVPESIELTTSGATKLFDIFVQAAPEIIAAFPTTAKKAGAAVTLFDANNKFTSDGIAFLQGAPATQAQIDLLNNVATSASTPAIGQTLAVATLLAAAHTCE
jgi:hypothetical protein